jgi:hypothetical protein
VTLGYARIPKLILLISPARNIEAWETGTASAGVSLRVGRKTWEYLMVSPFEKRVYHNLAPFMEPICAQVIHRSSSTGLNLANDKI